MSTIVLGNTVGLYVNNQLIGCLVSNSFSSTNAEIEVTCKDQGGARQVRGGSNSAEMPFEGNFDPASTYGLEDLLGIHKNKTLIGIKQYDTESGLYITAYAYINTLGWTGALNAASTFTGTFTISGAWNYATAT